MLSWTRRISPRCREAAKTLSCTSDVQPPLLDRAGVFMHLLLCTPCRHYRKSLKILKLAMKAINHDSLPDAAVILPSESKDRIRTALRLRESN